MALSTQIGLAYLGVTLKIQIKTKKKLFSLQRIHTGYQEPLEDTTQS